VILSDLANYSMTRDIARPLCDSWASCHLLRREWEWNSADHSTYPTHANVT